VRARHLQGPCAGAHTISIGRPYAIWLYHRYALSFRDVEDLLAGRGARREEMLTVVSEMCQKPT
jgi:hypothetical protein